MDKRIRPVIIDKNADGLMQAAEECPGGCFFIKGNMVFVHNPFQCNGCKNCESVCKGIKVEEK